MRDNKVLGKAVKRLMFDVYRKDNPRLAPLVFKKVLLLADLFTQKETIMTVGAREAYLEEKSLAVKVSQFNFVEIIFLFHNVSRIMMYLDHWRRQSYSYHSSGSREVFCERRDMAYCPQDGGAAGDIAFTCRKLQFTDS